MRRDRKIGVWLATILVASNIIGSGIFLLPATLAEIGSITLIGWLVASAGALVLAAVFAKLAAIAPEPGGIIAQAGIGLGRYAGFQAGIVYWVSCWTGNVAIAIVALGYLANFFPILSTPAHSAAATCGLILLMTALNLFGPRMVCQFESAALIAGLIPIVLVSVLGWWSFSAETFRQSWNVSHAAATVAVPRSLVLVAWAFLGMESASVATAVVKNPERNVPIATLGGVAVSALVYILSCTVIMGLIPAAELARSSAPFADAMRAMLGPAMAGAVALLALFKAAGSLAGWILMGAETAKTAAGRGLFPPVFGRVNRYGAPTANLLIMAMIMCTGVYATVSPTLGAQFGKMISVATLLALVVYVYACAAIWRYRPPELAHPGRYRGLAACGIAFSIGLGAVADASLLEFTAIVMLATLPLYWLFQGRAAHPQMIQP